MIQAFTLTGMSRGVERGESVRPQAKSGWHANSAEISPSYNAKFPPNDNDSFISEVTKP